MSLLRNGLVRGSGHHRLDQDDAGGVDIGAVVCGGLASRCCVLKRSPVRCDRRSRNRSPRPHPWRWHRRRHHRAGADPDVRIGGDRRHSGTTSWGRRVSIFAERSVLDAPSSRTHSPRGAATRGSGGGGGCLDLDFHTAAASESPRPPVPVEPSHAARLDQRRAIEGVDDLRSCAGARRCAALCRGDCHRRLA